MSDIIESIVKGFVNLILGYPGGWCLYVIGTRKKKPSIIDLFDPIADSKTGPSILAGIILWAIALSILLFIKSLTKSNI